MNIALPDELIRQLKQAHEGYDVPETQEEIEKAITEILRSWIFHQTIS